MCGEVLYQLKLDMCYLTLLWFNCLLPTIVVNLNCYFLFVYDF